VAGGLDLCGIDLTGNHKGGGIGAKVTIIKKHDEKCNMIIKSGNS